VIKFFKNKQLLGFGGAARFIQFVFSYFVLAGLNYKLIDILEISRYLHHKEGGYGQYYDPESASLLFKQSF